jgi:hypothetical protein
MKGNYKNIEEALENEENMNAYLEDTTSFQIIADIKAYSKVKDTKPLCEAIGGGILSEFLLIHEKSIDAYIESRTSKNNTI